MAVYNTTNVRNSRDLLSQTPPDFVQQNYFLKTLQDKVDADWEYRPNRAIIEKEDAPGSETYQPIDVVFTSVKGDTGENVSDDWRRITFKHINEQTRMGQRYRFAKDFNSTRQVKDEEKNIWLTYNQGGDMLTASQVICRCNGTLGSIYVDEDNKTHYHYEPVVNPYKLSSSGQWISDVSIDPKGTIILLAQYNKYTAQYYMNQRFIYGAVDQKIVSENGQIVRSDFAQVYKVTNIMKGDSETTYKPDDVALMKIYLDVDQLGELDDLKHRIAYNEVVDNPAPTEYYEDDEENNYYMQVINPKTMPEYLGSEDLLVQVAVFDQHGVDTLLPITIGDLQLTGSAYAIYADVNDFVEVTEVEFNTFKFHRKKKELTFNVSATCYATLYETDDLHLTFEMRLWGE